MKNYTEINHINENSQCKKYIKLLVVLIFFHAFCNFVWIRLNHVFSGWDPVIHTLLTYKYADYVVKNLSSFNFLNFLKISDYYPLFVYLISSPFAMIVKNFKVIQFVGTIYFLINILFIYLYFSKKTGKPKIGFITAFVFSFFITVFEHSRMQMLDLPLTALIIMSLFFLERFEEKERLKDYVWFILCISFAQLTKWYAFIYLAIPILFFIVRKLFNKKKIVSLKVGLFGLSTFLLITIPWYLTNYKSILLVMKSSWSGEVIGRPDLFSVDNLLIHLKWIELFQTNFFGFILLLISFIWLFFSKIKIKKELLSVVVFNYLFFTLIIQNRNIRYLIPLMPYIALVMAYGLVDLLERKQLIANFLAVFVLTYYVFAYFILSFGFPLYPQYKYSVKFPLIQWLDIYYLADYPVRLIYDLNGWPIAQIIQRITNESRFDNGKSVKVFLDADRHNLNQVLINYYLYITGSKIDASSYIDTNSQRQIKEYINQFDYVLVPKINVVGEDKNYILYLPLKVVHDYFLSGRATNYKLISQYLLPASQSLIDDRDVLYLYKKVY